MSGNRELETTDRKHNWKTQGRVEAGNLEPIIPDNVIEGEGEGRGKLHHNNGG